MGLSSPSSLKDTRRPLDLLRPRASDDERAIGEDNSDDAGGDEGGSEALEYVGSKEKGYGCEWDGVLYNDDPDGPASSDETSDRQSCCDRRVRCAGVQGGQWGVWIGNGRGG